MQMLDIDLDWVKTSDGDTSETLKGPDKKYL